MFSRIIPLFQLFGCAVRGDVSWLVIAVSATWLLARGVFPERYENLETATYWWMGIAGAMGFFVSIVAHEFFRAFVARHYGISMKGVTLFICSGAAERESEPPSVKAESLVAVADPMASILIAGICFGLSLITPHLGWPIPITRVLL